jgi:hypothetical protein
MRSDFFKAAERLANMSSLRPTLPGSCTGPFPKTQKTDSHATRAARQRTQRTPYHHPNPIHLPQERNRPARDQPRPRPSPKISTWQTITRGPFWSVQPQGSLPIHTHLLHWHMHNKVTHSHSPSPSSFNRTIPVLTKRRERAFAPLSSPLQHTRIPLLPILLKTFSSHTSAFGQST